MAGKKKISPMSLTLFFILLMAVLAVVFVFLFLSLRSALAKIEDVRRGQTENQALSLMQQQLGQLTLNLNQQLQSVNDQFLKTSGAIGQQLQSMTSQLLDTTGQIGESLGHVQSHLGKVEVVTREVLEKSKNIATLEDLLRAPKFRGGLGELFLGDLLSQILPPAHYELQYKFKSGEKVDAVIKIGNSLVPIDAKFPLENFKKYVQEDDPKEKDGLKKKFMGDVKKHVDGIATKYILPDEGTYDFALMYIPAENIYYETILKDESFGEEKSLLSYTVQKRVIPVSPNSFYAYLQVIILGLKGLQIEKSALSIFQALARLRGDLGRFKNDFQVLGTHLANAKSKYDDSEKRLGRVADRLTIIGGEQPEELLEEKIPNENSEKDPD
jgi:DNA recombination protein RmuC